MDKSCFPPQIISLPSPTSSTTRIGRMPMINGDFHYLSKDGGERQSQLDRVFPKDDVDSPLTTYGDLGITFDTPFANSVDVSVLIRDEEPKSLDEWLDDGCTDLKGDDWKVNFLKRIDGFLNYEFKWCTGSAPEFLQYPVKEENKSIIVQPQVVPVGIGHAQFEFENIIIILNHDLDSKYLMIAIFICMALTRRLNEATEKYKIDYLRVCGDTSVSYIPLLLEENTIPQDNIMNWRRVICGFMKPLWQWLTTFTDVALLARAVSELAPEVTHWAHLLKYPSHLDKRWQSKVNF